MFPFKLLSHPDRLLADHLSSVCKTALKRFDALPFRFDGYFDRHKLRTVLEYACLLHDMGKATTAFQEYIESPATAEASESARRKRRHGLISSLITLIYLQEQFPDDPVYAAFGLIMVRRHHGDLKDLDELFTIIPDDRNLCMEQSRSLSYPELSEILKMNGFKEEFSEEKIVSGIKDLFDNRFFFKQFRRKVARNLSLDDYFALNLLYSLLLEADKDDAIFNSVRRVETADTFHASDIRAYRELRFKSAGSIHAIRNIIFDGVGRKIETLEKSDHIVSINAPTGSGKTITALHAALLLKEKFNRDHIIYSLPFTSIIDQNYAVFEDILSSCGLKVDSGLLLKHHHLSDWTYRTADDDTAEVSVFKEYDANKSIFLIEGWHSRITVTTFVQLLYSLISAKNSMLRKFSRFSNAILILDEVQNIPHKYWKLVHHILKKAAYSLNSTILLVTATMPLIFDGDAGEIIELVPDHTEIFRSLSRIKLDVSFLFDSEDKPKITMLTDFLTMLREEVSAAGNKSFLIVANTIRSAKSIYEYIADCSPGHDVEFLSSHVLPRGRMNRIEKIKSQRESGGKPVILVSTQLVEAGVDLDFDVVWRDMAPLDSIFQVCGRCNRHDNPEKTGYVRLFSLIDENGRRPSAIYDGFLLQKTLKVLSGKSVILEEIFPDLAGAYFKEVREFQSDMLSGEILENLGKLAYKTALGHKKFELIDDHFTGSVFVEADDNALMLWREYERILEEETGFERNDRLKKIHGQLSAYIINIPRGSLPERYDGGIYHLSRDHVDTFYDHVTGFKMETQLPELTESVFF
ncbi:MAG: CRISPR-associated helicase Cas3' [Calditrichaceae bacterium]